ncbi:MAG: co-chaperone GroES [Candidatus Omnitrophica bacterium]|jgi:co-chaperonin GroES (HSP10)|nr:co-chaperone GroES [Candidatus Omnitrophota bacterium]
MDLNNLKRTVPDDKIIVEQISKDEAQTNSGLIIPESDENATLVGRVIEIGPGRLTFDGSKRVKPLIQKGDIVVYPKFAPQKVEYGDGNIYWIIKENDVHLYFRDQTTIGKNQQELLLG